MSGAEAGEATASTRERLVHAAREPFWEKGYAATSVAEILARAEANSGSLHHFFGTKQDLLLEVLRTYRDGIGPMLLDRAWADVSCPIERVFALLARYRELLEATDCFYGCPIGSLALELHEPDPPVREALAQNFDAWCAAVEVCLEEAGPRLRTSLDRGALARHVLAVMEGAVMQARTHRSLDAYDACIAMLRDHFERLEAAAGTS